MFGNEQGSATVMMQVTLDASGAMAPASVTDPVSRNAYAPYGAVRGADNLSIDHGWLNQVSDEASTGLVYLNARYYDTESSRFVSPDPLMNPADPRTLDAFRYAENNPVTYTDASGMCSTTGSWAYVGGVLEPPCNTTNNTKGKAPRYDDSDYAPPKKPDWNHGDSGWQGTGGLGYAPADPSVLNFLAGLGIHMDANGGTSCETQACIESGANYWAPGAAADGAYRDRGGPRDPVVDAVLGFLYLDDADSCAYGSGAGEHTLGCVALGINFVPGANGAKWSLKGGGKLLKWLTRILGHGDEAADAVRMFGKFSKSDLRAAAQAYDRNGFTQVGRALQKHSGRPDSVYRGLSAGTAAERNAQGLRMLDEILGDPNGRTEVLQNVTNIWDSSGRGVRYSSSGSFMGFLEPVS